MAHSLLMITLAYVWITVDKIGTEGAREGGKSCDKVARRDH